MDRVATVDKGPLVLACFAPLAVVALPALALVLYSGHLGLAFNAVLLAVAAAWGLCVYAFRLGWRARRSSQRAAAVTAAALNGLVVFGLPVLFVAAALVFANGNAWVVR